MEKVRVMKCVLSCENQTVRWLHEFLSKAAEVLQIVVLRVASQVLSPSFESIP